MKTSSSLTPAEVQRLAAEGCCQIIDVREPVEFAEEHIVGTQLLPLGELERRSGEIDKSKPVVVMCRAGSRGQQAQTKLEALGFTSVSNLEGGILAWKSAGLPLQTATRKVLPLMRQVQLIVGLVVLSFSVLAIAVNPWFALLPAVMGTGLTIAGSTGWCGLALLLAKMPWNNGACSCDAA